MYETDGCNQPEIGIMKDRSSEQLLADIERELAEAKVHGTEGLLRTSPPRLVFTAGELRIISAALKSAVGEPGFQIGGSHA
jgi:hypothetical protein